MDFFKLKNSDQIYLYLDSWCSAGGILEPGTVFFITLFLPLDPDSESGSGSKDLIESGSNPDPKHCFLYLLGSINYSVFLDYLDQHASIWMWLSSIQI